MLKHTGTIPGAIKPASILPIESGGAAPRRVAHGTYANTLRVLNDGEWFRIKHNSRQAVYAAAKKIGAKVRIERFPNRTGARVWRLK